MEKYIEKLVNAYNALNTVKVEGQNVVTLASALILLREILEEIQSEQTNQNDEVK